MKRKGNKYLKLFISTFYLSAFTFGGGYVIVPLMKEKFVKELGWIDEEEMYNFVAIAQSSPGAIAVNASMLVGFHVAGPVGAAIAVLGTILPPLIIISIISLFYQAFRDNKVVNAVLRGMQAGVAAVITNVVITMGIPFLKEKKWLAILVMLTAFLINLLTNINVVFIILGGGVLGAIVALVKSKKGAKE